MTKITKPKVKRKTTETKIKKRVGRPKIIKSGYIPREWQKDLHGSKARWRVLVCHRRSGKTVSAVLELINNALQNPWKRYAYVCPFRNQAKAVAWDIIKLYTSSIPDIKYKEWELTVVLPNGETESKCSKITLYGADNPDALRGLDFYGVVYDEYAQQPRSIHPEIILPMLAANGGWALWIGTPKGQNAFYDVYREACKNEDWSWWVKELKASESGIISKKELSAIRKQTSKEIYEQEYECNFFSGVLGAYYSEAIDELRDKGRIRVGVFESMLPVYTAWDMGNDDYTAIVFFQIIGSEMRIIDYYQNRKKPYSHYARICADKTKYIYETHFFPWDVSKSEESTNISRVEVLKELFGSHKVKVLERSSVMEGIENARVVLANHTLFDDNNETKKLLELISLYQQEWDDKKQTFKQTPKHDYTSHAADAFRYACMAYKLIFSGEFIEEDFVYEVDYNLF